MINPFLMLSGAGMMLAGILPLLWWRRKTLVPWRVFWFGAGLWAAAIAAKVILDLTATPFLIRYLSYFYAPLGMAVMTGAYVGLRTGFFESGLTYVAGIKAGMKKYDLEQAVALGLGFGCAEAILLGFGSFLNIAVLIAFPQLISMLPAVQQAALLEQLTLPSTVVFAPIIERAFTMMVHVFCTLLVVIAIRTGRSAYLALSVAAKTLLDGIIPWLSLTFDKTSVIGIYSMEAFIAVIGSACLAATWFVAGRFGKLKKRKKESGKKMPALLSLVAAVTVITALALTAPYGTSPLERRPADLSGLSGTFVFIYDDQEIGSSTFWFSGERESEGRTLYVISEETDLSVYDIMISSEAWVTADATPVFYNMTITKDGEEKTVTTRFLEGGIAGTRVTEAGGETVLNSAYSPDTLLIANNMIGGWELMFRTAVIEPGKAYAVRFFSPNIASEVTRSYRMTGTENVTTADGTFEVFIFEEQGGSRYYFSKEGRLLRISNPRLEIALRG